MDTDASASASLAPPEGAATPTPQVEPAPGRPPRPSASKRRAANLDASQQSLVDILPDIKAGDKGLRFGRFPTTSLMRHPKNNRQALDEANVKDKMASIQQFSFISNLVLTPVPPDRVVEEVVIPEGIEHLIVDGWHRHEAALRLGIAFVPGVVRDDWTPAQIAALSHSANAAHGLPTPYEDALYIREMLAAGKTIETIARDNNRPTSWVEQRLLYLDVPRELGILLGDGRHKPGCISVAKQLMPDTLDTAWIETIYAELLRGAREKRDEEGEAVPLRPGELRNFVVRALKEKHGAIDLDRHEYRQHASSKRYQAAVEECEAVTIPIDYGHGSTPLVLAPAPIKAAIEEIEAQVQKKEKRAVARGTLSPEDAAKRAATRRQNKVKGMAREMQQAMLKKALAPLAGPEPRVVEVLVMTVAPHVRFHHRAADAIADICGLDVDEVKDAQPTREDPDRLLRFFRKLAKKDEAVAYRFLAAACAFYHHEPLKTHNNEARNEPLFKLLTGRAWADVEKSAERELEALAKRIIDKKEPKPKKTEDARSVPCPNCIKPNGGGGVEGAYCIGNSGQRTRVFCTARLKLWEKATKKRGKLAAEAPQKGRPKPKSGTRARKKAASARPPPDEEAEPDTQAEGQPPEDVSRAEEERGEQDGGEGGNADGDP